jgi:hypothetical protein
MKFKNKKTGVVIETKNMFEENILKGNSNYTEVKEKAAVNENKVQKAAEKGGK